MVGLFDFLEKWTKYIFFVAILGVGTYGFHTDRCAPDRWRSARWPWPWSRDAGAGAADPGFLGLEWFQRLADSLYRTIQLFAFEFARDCSEAKASFPLPLWIETARYLAAIFTVLALASVLVPRFRRWMLIRWHILFGHLFGNGRRAVVLGYGPAGQAVARELARQRRGPKPRQATAGNDWFRERWHRGMFVTAIHKGVTPALAESARRDNVVLVEGDPSEKAIHRRAALACSSLVVAATGNDMDTIDAIVAARASLDGGRRDLRAILYDPDLAAALPETAPQGFLGAPEVRVYSLASEAARLLFAEARFDRTALEAGQKRVHVAILGCGAQGEAVAIETLLCGWRAELGPPLVSILDKASDDVRARFVRRAPALFLTGDKALPEPARAEVKFFPLDLETLDFSSDQSIAALRDGSDPVTAWVFAAGKDALNLQAAAALHQAMLRGRLATAPIHVRIWSGHQGDTPVLSANPVALARPFGALETTIAESFACAAEPDMTATELHEAYRKAGEAASKKGTPLKFSDQPWQDLPETLRESNRRLHRHAAMKFEDLGGQWRKPRARAVPVVEKQIREGYVNVEARIDYGKQTTGELVPDWWLTDENGQPQDSAVPDQLERIRAGKLVRTASTEHNRWTVDRAIDGWRMTPEPKEEQRNKRARLHHNMHAWHLLGGDTRRYDAILLRALVQGDEGRESDATAWEKKEHRVRLATEATANGGGLVCRVLDADTMPAGVTEIQVLVGNVLAATEPEKSDPEKTLASARETFAGLLLRPGMLDRLCRIRFEFDDPPNDAAIAIANAIGAMVRSAERPWWWRRSLVRLHGSAVSRASLALAGLPGIEVSARWGSRPAAPAGSGKGGEAALPVA